MSYELFIAKRYLRSKRKTGFISLITYISIIGVMIGVAALVIVLSVANGFESEVRSRIIGFDAHVRVRTFHDRGIESEVLPDMLKKLDDMAHVTGVAPCIFEKGLIVSAKSKQGVFIKGIDPEREPKVTTLIDNIVYGSLNLDTLHVEKGKAYPGIIIGRWLGDRLAVNLGDRVQVLTAAGVETGGMGSMPRFRTFRVAGFFETGLYEYDDNYAFVSIAEAQRLAERRGNVSWIQLKLTDMTLAEDVARVIEKQFGYPYTTDTWFEMHQNLFAWMELEKKFFFLILSLIIMVAAFNIVSTLIMVVLEKRKDIGVLKSMGAHSRHIMNIFVYEGLVAGSIGTVLGLILGYAVCFLQLKTKFIALPGDVYIINAIPIEFHWLDGVAITVASLLISYVATLYPSYKASKLDPVEAIRYE
ncbi:MAG: lipoprotein-releasing ABC transporter permease subunit [Deferribacteres bacterium]|nr:lipoprotein-releasing ABC transporter permease subunit [candidate division KSB1 bacterium]MCB9504189.1 lipoprotein-releasing ABC transporter permease subunit [Deferribacteres bacterium]